MDQIPPQPHTGNHGNKYLTGALLAVLALGMFAATVGHLLF
jgi:hypothetical protein